MGVLPPPIAFFGGTFDPIHNGHLWIAKNAAAEFNCTVRLVPNGEPPHRPRPVVSYQQRLLMCRLATADLPMVTVGEDEHPGTVRYTIDSLATIKKTQKKNETLLLIVGTDAFAELHRWHRWRDIFAMAHIIVADRGNTAAPDLRNRQISKEQLNSGCGGVYHWRCRPPDITARHLRTARQDHNDDEVMTRLPPAVWDYIRNNRLYRPDSPDRPD